MLHLQQPALLRMTSLRGDLTWIAVAAIIAGSLLTDSQAVAQTMSPPCHEVIAGRMDVAPRAPMLVDKCSGRTWLLARDGRGSWRWMPIAVDKPAADATPSPGSGSEKCFIFNNRKFCE